MEEISLGEIVALVLLFLLTFGTAGTIYSYHTGVISSGLATLLISGIGALASVILATATFATIRQNRVTVEELKKDREKAVILDLLQQCIMPAIDSLKNAETIKFHINYREHGTTSGLRLSPPPKHSDIDPATWKFFGNNYPELREKFASWYEFRRDLYKEAQKYQDKICPEVEEYPTGESVSSDNPRAQRVISALINDRELQNEEFWEKYGDELQKMAYNSNRDQYADMRHLQWRLFKLIAETKPMLVEEKLQLQREYGISNEEIESD